MQELWLTLSPWQRVPAGGWGASYTAHQEADSVKNQFGFSALPCLTKPVSASKPPVFNPSLVSMSWVDCLIQALTSCPASTQTS